MMLQQNEIIYGMEKVASASAASNETNKKVIPLFLLVRLRISYNINNIIAIIERIREVLMGPFIVINILICSFIIIIAAKNIGNIPSVTFKFVFLIRVWNKSDIKYNEDKNIKTMHEKKIFED